MTKKTILITGGLGYIGSHAVVAFEEAGYKTVIVDSLINSSKESLSGISKILGYTPDFYELDLRDKENLISVFDRYLFDGVIHFAGLKSPFQSQKNPLEYHDNNIHGSMVLFSVMEKYQVKKIVFSSSAAIYDSLNKSPCTEESKLGTQHPYGTTKLLIEYLLQDLAKNLEFKVIALRYFNPIWAHNSGLIGEQPYGIPNNLLPYILDVAQGKREKVMIFWSDYLTIDGTWVRDYIDVNDLVDAHLVAYKKLDCEKNGMFVPINIGTGKGTSVLEMIRLVKEISGEEVPYEITDRRPGDLSEVYADVHFASRFLWWEAKKTVKEGVMGSWKFVENNKNNIWK